MFTSTDLPGVERLLDLTGTEVFVLTGRASILASQTLLEELATRSGQQGAADFIDYFLTQPYTGGKIAHLFLVLTKPVASGAEVRSEAVLGAVILQEYQLAKRRLGAFVTEDQAGERNVLAPAPLRSAVALRVADHLLEKGASLVVLSLQDAAFSPERGRSSSRAVWATVERTLTRRLPLGASYEDTLAQLGAHTRRNLRYYRRRLEERRQCRFVAEVLMEEDEFVALNRLCSYPTPEFVARWRYRSTHSVPGGVFSGIQAGDGTWLSIIGGRRSGRTMFVDWQMNRTAFADHSLSTVMRSYLIEHEILAGSGTLLFEGGTPHSMQLSFLRETVTDLALVRDTVRGRLLRRYAKAVLPKRNFVRKVLTSPGLAWRSYG